ncbi:hypothetical protein [Microvirga massiliensis]|uniref:hypothetical protein n=1 Tax=Microvirga massiliensis TaxID=1033741 RepID=UPI00062BCAA3|nr:hypothetical protein [Microvirga massiliensis]
MPKIHPSPFLRYALLGDAVASGAMGLLSLGGAGLLAAPLGLPEMLLRMTGLILVPYAAAVAWLGTRPVASASRWAVWAVIAANVMWVVDSAILLLAGWVSPTSLGTAFVILQAVVVAGFAEAQFIGIRRAERPMTPALA